MEELNTRAKTKSVEDASVIVELLERDVLASLLQSPTSSVRTLTCDLLRNLILSVSSALQDLDVVSLLRQAALDRVHRSQTFF